jgi:hypothetical protein
LSEDQERLHMSIVNFDQDAVLNSFRGLPRRPACERNCSRRSCK